MAEMDLLSASPGNGYAAQTLMFTVTVAVLALPIALLFAASFLQRRKSARSGSRGLAGEPLRLRRFEVRTR
ncbi:MAG TPA: hypothetical protein VHX17_08275 [Candidatus Cybelea sp.]|nr:hypothetical protein [Candidatus Cybelea sp.]